jgi:hypothetical protein
VRLQQSAHFQESPVVSADVRAGLQNNGSPGIVITISRETGVFNLGQRRWIYGDPGESGSSPIRSFTALRNVDCRPRHRSNRSYGQPRRV